MDNKLALTKENLVSIIESSGVNNLIKPLVKEIYLFDTYISKTFSFDNKNAIFKLHENSRLILRKDKDNKFDDEAVLILNEDNEKIGYIPRKDNVIFSRLLGAGKLLSATVKEINSESDFQLIKIKIFLIDF